MTSRAPPALRQGGSSLGAPRPSGAAQRRYARTCVASAAPKAGEGPQRARWPALAATPPAPAPREPAARVACAGAGLDTEAAVATLRQAAGSSPLPPAGQVLAAMRALDAAKLDPAPWPEALGGGGPPGKRWRLVFTSGTKDVQKALKGAGGGALASASCPAAQHPGRPCSAAQCDATPPTLTKFLTEKEKTK